MESAGRVRVVNVRLGLISAFWRRPELTALFLRQFLSLPGIDLVLVAAVSPEDPEPSRHRSWYFVEAPNSPLSDKFNAAMQCVKEMDVDAAMILGSDDFINARLIEKTAEMIDSGSAQVMPGSAWFYSPMQDEMFYARCRKIGGGRTLSKAVLESCDYTPWESGYDRGIDIAMDRRLRYLAPPDRIDDLELEDAFLCGVKTDVNLWSFDFLKHLEHREVDPGATLRAYVPDVADKLMAICAPK